MAKIIVTHKNPDLDAIAAAWLLVRFDQSRFGDAALVFVPAGQTYKNAVVDSDEDVVHVDTGYGKFDHHQEGRFGTCATRLVWEFLVEQGLVAKENLPLAQLVEHVNEIDVFADCSYCESALPRFAFTLSEVISAMHHLQVHDNEAVTRMVFVYLDAVYQRLKDRQEALKAIEAGVKFESRWGKGVAVLTGADDVNKYALKTGFEIVIVRDPKKMRTAIKTAPSVTYPLRPLYDKIISLGDDPKMWFYHNSGHILINGSSKGEEVPPTKLSLETLIKLVQHTKT